MKLTAEADGANLALLLELEQLGESLEDLLVPRSADSAGVLRLESPPHEVLRSDLAVVIDRPALLASAANLLRDELGIVGVNAVEVVGSHQLAAVLDAGPDACGRVVKVVLGAAVAADLGDDLVRLARELVADFVKHLAEHLRGGGGWRCEQSSHKFETVETERTRSDVL